MIKTDWYLPLRRFWSSPEAKIYQPWFSKKYQDSVSPPPSLFTLTEFFRHALRSYGDVIEFGVYQGGSAVLLAEQMNGSGKKFYLLDTFQGIPSVGPQDNFWQRGNFANTSVPLVREKMGDFPFVEILEGEFESNYDRLSESRFCFAHVDCDTYASVTSAASFLEDRMTPGGVIVYDDYGDYVSQGAKAAVDDFYSRKDFLYLPTKQAVVLK